MKWIPALSALWVSGRLWRDKFGITSPFLPVSIFGLGCLMASYLAWIDAKPLAILTPLMTLSALMILMWWLTWVSSLHAMASPTQLQLVPGLRKAITLKAVLLWIGASLLLLSWLANPIIFIVVTWLCIFCFWQDSTNLRRIAIFISGVWLLVSLLNLFVGGPDSYPPFPFDRQKMPGAVLAFLLFALALIGLMRVFVFASLTFLAVLVGIFRFTLDSESPLLPHLFFWVGAHPLYVCGVALILFGMLSYGLVGQAGDRKIMRYETHLTNWRMSVEMHANPDARPAWHLFEWLLVGYAWSLDRVQKRGSNARKMLVFLFGPSVHWSAALGIALLYMALFVFLHSLMRGNNEDSLVLAKAGNLVLYAVPFFMLSPFANFISYFYRTRREQTLLTLTPFWLGATPLNRWQLLFVLRYLCLCLGTCVVVMTGVAWLYHVPLANPAALALAMLVMASCAFNAAAQDYAHWQPPPLYIVLAKTVLMLLPYFLYCLTVLMDGPWLPVGVGLSLALLALAAWRWRKIANGPAALPCGRLRAERLQ